MKRRFANAVVVSSMVLAIGLCCTPPCLYAQKSAAAPPTGWLSTALEDVLKTKYRPLKNFQNFQSWLGDPNERSIEVLEDNLKSVVACRDLEAKNWKALQGARRAGVARAPFDPQINAARLLQVARERQLSIDELHAEENRQFRAAYGFNLKEGFLAHTPEEEKIAAQWMSSKAHRNFVEQEAELVKEYEARIQAVLKDHRNKTDPTEREIDRLEKETLARYQEIIKAEKLIRDAINRKQNAPPPPPPELIAGESDGLKVTCGQSSYEAAVSETINVVVTIAGGKPSYQLSVRKVDGETLIDTSLSEEGQKTVPISFDRPGTHTAYVAVRDESPTAKLAQLTISFRITGDEPAPSEPPQATATKPQPSATKPRPSVTKPQAPATPPQVVEQPYTPWRLAPGTYRAHFWVGFPLTSVMFRKNITQQCPVPATLTIAADGRIDGTAGWCPQDADLDRTYMAKGQTFKANVSFRFDGNADWDTGAIQLKIRDCKQSQTDQVVYETGGKISRSGFELEMDLDSTGWQVGHPAYVKALKGALKAAPVPLAANHEDNGFPQFTDDADGKPKFHDLGWAGMPEVQGSGAAISLVAGPGGGARIALKKHIQWNEYPDSPHQDIDLRGKWRIATDSPWYLKILGQATPQTPQPPPPPPRPVDKGELTAFGIWPIDSVTARTGEAYQVEAVGVYLDDPFEAVKLSDRVTWELPPGITRNADGTFRAAAPGKYTVKAVFRRPDGDVMSDIIQVIVGP